MDEIEEDIIGADEEADTETNGNDKQTNMNENQINTNAFEIAVDRASDTLTNKHRARILKHIFRKLKAAPKCTHCTA
jgi:hypothetical protein